MDTSTSVYSHLQLMSPQDTLTDHPIERAIRLRASWWTDQVVDIRTEDLFAEVSEWMGRLKYCRAFAHLKSGYLGPFNGTFWTGKLSFFPPHHNTINNTAAKQWQPT